MSQPGEDGAFFLLNSSNFKSETDKSIFELFFGQAMWREPLLNVW
jgi:hypothetical protein